MVDFDLTNFPISHERPAIDDGWTWKDRIRPNVVLFAPETGDRFEGFWIGGDRSFNKKLGLFDFPNIGGTVGQDLAKVGTRYPIQFFFAGKDHDRQANQFFKACANYGLWEVEHPLFGYFGGLLVSVRQSFNITDNANATSIDCEFVETIDPNSLLTQAEFSEFLNEDIYDLSDLSATDFANRAKKFPANALAKLADCVEAIQKAVDTVLGPIAALNNTVYNSLQAVQVAIQDTLRAVIFQPLALAGQIQQTIALPGLIANDIKARLTGYANLMEQMFAPENSATRVVRADPGYFNVALAREQYGTAIIAHAGRAIGEAQINSRQEAIDLGNQYWAMIDSFIRNNDEAQKKFGTEVLQDQFIGMEETYAATMKYALLVTQRLIRSIWDANVERKLLFIY